jgi:mannosyl-glycoprotein endo-beta-N-acetylglucosaminidase
LSSPLLYAWKLTGERNMPTSVSCVGGYVEDRVPFAAAGFEGRGANHYFLRQWNSVDTFVYFSHHRVSIPPPGWTHAAHLHGTKVLGTLITEWDGALTESSDLLTAPDRIGSQLASVAKYYGFDGWFVNFETRVEGGAVRERVERFLAAVRAHTRREVGEHALVLWYDSVTKDGKLQWQNALNEENACFFEGTREGVIDRACRWSAASALCC